MISKVAIRLGELPRKLVEWFWAGGSSQCRMSALTKRGASRHGFEMHMKRQGAKIELWDNLMALFKKKPSPAE